MTDTQEISGLRQALDRPYCQVSDCLHRAGRVVEIELPAGWDPTATYTALTVHAGFCVKHGSEVERRVTALVEARDDLRNLLVVIESAILSQRGYRTACVGA